jgi:ERCC4-type nuclease
MNPIVHRLVVLGLEEKDAEALVKAGLDTPRKIKAASDKEIEAVPGIGKAKRAELRERFPKKG